MKTQFDFNAIRGLLNRSDFKMVLDGLNGAVGPYAKSIFQEELGNKILLVNCDPDPTFKGLHPDPNL